MKSQFLLVTSIWNAELWHYPSVKAMVWFFCIRQLSILFDILFQNKNAVEHTSTRNSELHLVWNMLWWACSWCKESCLSHENHKTFKLERTRAGFSSSLLLKAGSAMRSDQAAQIFVQLDLKNLLEWRLQSTCRQSAPTLACPKDGFIQKFTSEINFLMFSQTDLNFLLINYKECSFTAVVLSLGLWFLSAKSQQL